MTREELEAELSAARREVANLERGLLAHREADAVANTSSVITINNTTISWAGVSPGSRTDPELVSKIRGYIAAEMRGEG